MQRTVGHKDDGRGLERARAAWAKRKLEDAAKYANGPEKKSSNEAA